MATKKVMMLLLLLLICEHRTEHAVPLVNVPDFKGWTPLHYACCDNNLEFVELLLAAGANRDARYVSTSRSQKIVHFHLL